MAARTSILAIAGGYASGARASSDISAAASDRGWTHDRLPNEHDVLAYMTFPKEHRTKLHSINSIERINGEIKRRAIQWSKIAGRRNDGSPSGSASTTPTIETVLEPD